MVASSDTRKEKPGSFWTDQLNNTDQIAAYQHMGEEVWSQTDGRIDAFVHSVGTAGSLRGNSEVLRRHHEGIKIVAALRVAEQLASDSTIITLMCDTGMKYLSSALYRAHTTSRLAD